MEQGAKSEDQIERALAAAVLILCLAALVGLWIIDHQIDNLPESDAPYSSLLTPYRVER